MLRNPPHIGRLGWRALFGMVIGALFLGYVYVLAFGQSLEPAVSLASDDAFYYMKIARNIIRGEGCTFDGIAPTNGFHPLWMVCVLFVYWLVGMDLETPVRVLLVLNGLLCILTLVLLYRLIHKYVAPGLGLITVAGCLLPNLVTAMTNGMETGLLLFLLVALIGLCYSRGIHLPLASAKSSFAFGALLGLIALCRLDSVFVLVAAASLMILAPLVMRLPVRACARALAFLLTGCVLITAPYVIWNVAYFEHIMPISGAAKSSFPALRNSLTLDGDMALGAGLLVGLVLLVLFVAADDYQRTRSLQSTFQSPLTLLVLACIFHFLHAFLFLAWGIYWWHFVVYGISIAIALPLAVNRLTQSRLHWRRPITVSLVAAMAALGVMMKARELSIKGPQHMGWLEAAEWARAHTPADAVFALRDAGLFGYFSDRRVINLDAKANSYEYLKHLRQDDVESYLTAAGTTFVANISAEYASDKAAIAIPRVNQPRTLLVMDRQSEVFRGTLIPAHAARFGAPRVSRFTIWRYERTGTGSK